jgi:tRNA U55 pseudouridine synthase TruB
VTNAPWEDQEKYGRLRDILLQGAALAEAKARTITVNNLISSQHTQVTSIMDMIKSVSAETQMYARDIMKNLSEELHIAAMTLDLTEEQEAKLLQLSREAFDSMEVLYQNSDALEQHFHSLINSITAVQALTKNEVKKKEPEPENDEDIELF